MEFLEAPFFDDDVFKLIARFGMNLFFLFLLLVWAIKQGKPSREYTFTAVMLNVIVFFICFTMKKLELDLGLALGLFAVFGVLRYRTDSLRPKEMTYLFVVIGIALINSLTNKKTSYVEVLLVNSLIVGIAIYKESLGRKDNASTPQSVDGMSETSTSESKKDKNKENGKSKDKNKDKDDTQDVNKSPNKMPNYRVEYDRIEWLGEAHRGQVLSDLKQRTGMDVIEFKIRKIDLVEKRASLEIWTALPIESVEQNS